MSKKIHSLTIALGEHSGHHHTITGEIDIILDSPDIKIFSGSGILKHQEHDLMLFDLEEDEIVVTTIQEEFDPLTGNIRQVLD